MSLRRTLLLCTLVAASLLAATGCDSGSQAPATPTVAPTPTVDCNICEAELPTRPPKGTPGTPAVATATATAAPQSSAPGTTPVDTAQVIAPPTPNESLAPPTVVTTTGTGPAVTALTALPALKAKALAWQADARLAMLADVRPGQERDVLGTALGDPTKFEPTPGGLGKNWTLVAVSPTRGAFVVSTEGTQIDLSAEQQVTGESIGNFSSPGMAALDLSTLDPTKLVDSDKLVQKAGSRASGASTGVALVVPQGLGEGPMPTPAEGGQAPLLVYQLFSTDPAKQISTYFDATSGEVLLDASAP